MQTIEKRSLVGIRHFLSAQAVNVPSDAGEEQVCRALFSFLVDHRTDISLWYGLTRSIRETGCREIHLRPKDDSATELKEMLTNLARLRKSLPEPEEITPDTYAAFRQRLHGGLLSLFLTAAIAGTGCSNIDGIMTDAGGSGLSEDSASANSTDAEETETTTEIDTGLGDTDTIEACIPTGKEIIGNGIDDDCDGTVDCRFEDVDACTNKNPLHDTVMNACMTSMDKSSLCECFDDLPEDWIEGLAHLFETGTADEVADVLDHLTFCCSYDTDFKPNAPFDDETVAALKGHYLCEEIIYIYIIAAFTR